MFFTLVECAWRPLGQGGYVIAPWLPRCTADPRYFAAGTRLGRKLWKSAYNWRLLKCIRSKNKNLIHKISGKKIRTHNSKKKKESRQQITKHKPLQQITKQKEWSQQKVRGFCVCVLHLRATIVECTLLHINMDQWHEMRVAVHSSR